MKTTSAPPAARHPLLILLLLTSAFRLPPSAFSAAPDPLIPAALAPDRYKALAARSPFSPPTAEAPPPVVAPTPPPPGWGEKYTLGGLAQFGAGYKVTLNPKNPAGPANASAGGGNVSPTERIIVVTGAPSPDGITLAGVQWSDDPKQTRATLLKNGVPAVFTFDPSALSAAKGSAATAASIPAPRNSASAPAVPMMPNPGFTPPAPPPNGGMPPQPGIVRSPGTRAPIRPPSPPTGANGQPFVPPPPPPTVAPVRASRLPAPAVAVPGNVPADDDDD